MGAGLGGGDSSRKRSRDRWMEWLCRSSASNCASTSTIWTSRIWRCSSGRSDAFRLTVMIHLHRGWLLSARLQLHKHCRRNELPSE